MPKVFFVEKRIFKVEGVRVKFMQNGRNVRSDREILPQYNAQRMLKNSASVNDLINLRLKVQFPGFDFVVLKSDGHHASGQTKLSTVRDSYLEN